MNKNTGDGELDEIVQQIEIDSMIAFTKSRSDGDPKHHQEMIAKSKAAIKKYAAQEANKAQQQLLQGLLEQMPDDTIVATKYGYHSREKKYGFRMGMHEAQSVIQNKLEGLS